MKKKIGRPLTGNPKSNIVACRLTDDELWKLQEYCRIHNLSQTDVIRDGILKMIEEE